MKSSFAASLLALALAALTTAPATAQRLDKSQPVDAATAATVEGLEPTPTPGLPSEPLPPTQSQLPGRRPPTPAAALNLTMRVIDGPHLTAKFEAQGADARTIFVFVLVSLDPTLGQWAGLPATLLDAQVPMVVQMQAAATVDLGPAAFGYTWYLQGLAFRDWEFSSTNVATIAPR